jgi:murein DD-endopeptidase MepM/ murein hydrolase activator NlpD
MRIYLEQTRNSILQEEWFVQPYLDTNTVEWRVVGSEPYGPQTVPKVVSKPLSKRLKKSVNRCLISDTRQKTTKTKSGSVVPVQTAFTWPLHGGSFWVSSLFGSRPRKDGSPGFHFGIDLAANKGTAVYASRSGVIIHAGYDRGYGKTIVMQHGKQFKTRYAHLDKILVKTGDIIPSGKRIGAVGATGYVRKKGGDGSHLHFELYYRGKRVDPLQFLPDIVS